MGAAAGRADRRAWFHGRGAARNLASAGHNVVVFDLDLRRVEDLARTGARPASSGERPAAQVDVLFTSLSGPRQSAATIPGLIDALPSRAIWIDMTTTDRDLVVELATRAGGPGIAALDAPVTGAVDAARTGNLTMFVGGPDE
ncbi:MAG: hypothetical protein JO286_26910 [Solirubrobacterales bacterium]|nr:hypothetical protein [Solirubrobacterales bacterium]